MKWHEGPIVGFDTETTAPLPHEARLVTAAIVYVKPAQRPQTVTWLINLGVDIPDEAAAVHGWTTTRLNAQVPVGMAERTVNGATRPLPAAEAVEDISKHVINAMRNDVPLVIANAPYDTTVLDHELALAGARQVAVWRGVVDPMVIEKAFDPYRKVKGGCRGGKVRCGGCGTTDKTLTSLCLHYGVRHTGAHDAAADALAALRLAPKLAEAWPEIARWKLSTLHDHQVEWRRQQSDSLRAYFDKVGTEHDGICGSWPVHGDCCRRAAVPA